MAVDGGPGLDSRSPQRGISASVRSVVENTHRSTAVVCTLVPQGLVVELDVQPVERAAVATS